MELSFIRGRGLAMSWDRSSGPALDGIPIRLRIRGTTLFRVWPWVDSGETPAAWAEPALDVTLFSGTDDGCCQVEEIRRQGSLTGFRATARRPRLTAELIVGVEEDALSFEVSIHNPQGPGGLSLPLAEIELSVGPFPLEPGAEFLSAHAYGGRFHGRGRVSALPPEAGVSFRIGCTGLGLPLLYVFETNTRKGLEFELMSSHGVDAILRPAPNGATFAMRWQPERLLAPGDRHGDGEPLRLTPYQGCPIQRMRDWRDAAERRFSLVSPRTPDWARQANVIEFDTYLAHGHHPFRRLDDPRVRSMLEEWKARGYTAIFTVGHNHTGENWLSPFDYEPAEQYGGAKAERQYLDWAHELGFRAFLWITTVGMDRNAPEVRAHADWWTHRVDGSLFYAWDSTPASGYVGYAPDANPLSSGWRNWLKAQTTRIIRRGFDGVFVDGCIPRAANHANWDWPGQARNGVPDQVVDLARHVRSLDENLISSVEDGALYAQVCAEVTQGRYTPMVPLQRIGAENMMTGTGPAELFKTPRIAPEEARDYLLVRYASLLPDAESSDVIEGYWSEAARPWIVQSLLAGCNMKTHSQFIDDGIAGDWDRLGRLAGGLMAEMGEPPPQDRTPEKRKRGTEEFFSLLRLRRDDPQLRDAAMSIEAVAVDGDAAAVGILRPAARRCLLAVINFAGRPASVHIRLAEPLDVPLPSRQEAGAPHRQRWHAHERLRSMADALPAPAARLGPGLRMPVTLAPYGFRLFELRPDPATTGAQPDLPASATG